MPLVLSHRPTTTTRPPRAITLDGIVPDRIAGLSADAVARLPILADGRACDLGDVFLVTGGGGDGTLECRGDFSRVHGVAAGMLHGRVEVHGPVGRHAGSGMAGGTLRVHGDAGDWLGVGMAGGEVLVDGDAGDNVAAAVPGAVHGMRGGLVVVRGSAGCLVGSRLRRGVVAIGRECGSGAGLEMWAGTVVVGGRVGRHAGLGMRRGSLVVLAPDEPNPPGQPDRTPAWLPPGFIRGRTWSPAFLPLLFRRLERAGWPHLPAADGWAHWHGDMSSGGRGEILRPA